MDAAALGFLGVIVGAVVSAGLLGIKEWLFARAKKKKDLAFLSVLITCMLEKFTQDCADVVGDDGTYHGQRDEQGFCRPTVSTPGFNPLSVEVEWSSLPVNVMHDILRLPSEIESADSFIASVDEHSSSPPDFDELFEARQYQYALLGEKAYQLSNELRDLSNLPKIEISDWEIIKFMREEKSKIDVRRVRRAKEVQDMMDNSSIEFAPQK